MKQTKRRATHESQVPAAAPPVKETKGIPWWQFGIAVLAIFFLAFEIYGPSLHGPFLYDDTYLPFMNPETMNRPLRDWLGVRPVQMVTFWANYQMSGTDTYSYHVVNVILHVLNSLFVFAILRDLLGRVGETGWKRDLLAIFAGAVFLLHPVQTESVAYVASRSETLSVFFVLGALTVFLYRRRPEITWLGSILVLILFGAAVLSKEHTAVLPALLLVIDYFFNPGFSFEGVRKNWRLYIPIIIAGAIGLVFVARVLLSATTAGFGMKDLKWYEYLFTQFRAIWLYMRLYMIPVGLNIDWDVPISRSILDHGALFFALGLIGLLGLAIYFRKQFPLAAAGFIVFLLLLAPTSSIVPIRDVVAERRLYLPFIGLLMITVDFLRRWRTTPVTMAVALGAVSLVGAAMTYQRVKLWGDPVKLWEDAAAKSPNKSRPWFQSAFAKFQAQRCTESVKDYEQAAKLQAADSQLLIDWALALDCAQMPGEALAKLEQAAKNEPSAHVYSLIGMMHGKANRTEEALTALDQAEKLNAAFEMTYVYRGNVYASKGDFAKAAEQYRRALAVNPNNALARDGVAMAEQQLGQANR